MQVICIIDLLQLQHVVSEWQSVLCKNPVKKKKNSNCKSCPTGGRVLKSFGLQTGISTLQDLPV